MILRCSSIVHATKVTCQTNISPSSSLPHIQMITKHCFQKEVIGKDAILPFQSRHRHVPFQPKAVQSSETCAALCWSEKEQPQVHQAQCSSRSASPHSIVNISRVWHSNTHNHVQMTTSKFLKEVDMERLVELSLFLCLSLCVSLCLTFTRSLSLSLFLPRSSSW